MEVVGLVDKRNILMLIGCYCNSPKLVLDKKYETSAHDYDENFHKIIHGAIVNIAKRSSVTKITPIEIETELASFPSVIENWKINDGWTYIENAIALTEDKITNIELYHDSVRKYSVLRNAVKLLKMDISFIYNENEPTKMTKFIQMTSREILGLIYNKFNEFKIMWNSNFSDNYSFHAGDEIESRIKQCKEQDCTYGYPFQSAYLTTVFRGMRPNKYMVRSSKSGGGKTRTALTEACNISSDKLYDWSNQQWISTGEKKPVLFISTELTKEELQTCLLAHISGIEEDRLTGWENITPQEEQIIHKSGKIVTESLLFGEYQPDFTIDAIKETIEQYIINQNITHCFFDYINDSEDLYSFYAKKTGTKLQTHQILFLFSEGLKRLANNYNIYLGTSTQVSSDNSIKGSRAIIEKADMGILALPVSLDDLKKLQPLFDSGFYEKPTMAYYIKKNRGGKWKDIIVWTKLNMGTMREKDCFVTNLDFELITDIEKTIIEFQMNDVGRCEFNYKNTSSAHEYIDHYNKIQMPEE